MYDVSSQESFEGLEVWLNELDTYTTKKDLVKMLVGNKIDKVVGTIHGYSKMFSVRDVCVSIDF